ncbi:glycerate dehydrogenase [Dyadobacter jejuensis]|uniref:Glycerate dehydrogenase n=1 Tax=Dyadobacter jejuensis TaxID=1082580 RepID=A0A316AU47_9BACT|nr:D-2-hydroxyacid dehydrogenase [Dyadobacter jejuensis]PWJ60210.1 glycerate dehydrogenase [Dyadobacter jejuensis]
MNIVVLDGYPLNPGDLDWAPIESLGSLTVYDRSTKFQIIERSRSAKAILVNKIVINKEIIDQLPLLEYIGVMATGYNNIDLEAAKERGITVTNVKAYGPASVAQHTIGLLLAIANHVELHSQSVKRGDWESCEDFCYTKTPLSELDGKTMGLIGLGDIGTRVADLAHALGMKVVAYRKNPKKTDKKFIEMVTLERLFETSDVISLHCPLTEETHEIINEQRLASMKSNAILLNTGRGPLIHEKALADALREGVIAAAGLDVLSEEPPKSDNPLLTAPNCIITPHNAWASFEARQRLLSMVAGNLKAYSEGAPTNKL